MLESPLLTIDEVAQRVRHGRTWVLYELRAGRLQSVRIGKRRLIPVTALEQWLEARQSTPAVPSTTEP